MRGRNWGCDFGLRFMEGSLRSFSSGVLFSATLLICVGPLAGQVSSSGQGAVPVYKANARAVVVDVVVTRGNDEPVPALQKQEFKVLEDGKPQTIDFFEEHTAKALPSGALAPLPKMPPNVYSNVPPAPLSDAVNVLLIDTLNTEKQDQIFVRKQLLEFLKKMQPGTRVAVFTLGSSLRFVQGFTTDSAALVAAINDKKAGVTPDRDVTSHTRSDDADDAEHIRIMMAMLGGLSDEGVVAMQRAQGVSAEFQYAQRVSMTLEALNHLALYLAGVPGRKNLLWFSSSFPVTIFPTAAQRQQMADSRVYASAVKKTADLLTVSKVAVYPVDAEGMMNDHSMEADNNLEAAGGGGGLMRNIMEGAGARSDTVFAMRELAADTGGKAFYNTNDLNGAMQRAINDGSHYYTIVYSPTNKKMDGKYRRIEVQLAGGHAKLSYRRGYNADDTAAPEAAPDADPLKLLLTYGLPDSTQLLYAVRVAPAASQPAANAPRAGQNAALTGSRTRYTLDFFIRWTDVALATTPQGTHSGKIQLGLTAYDRGGKPVNWAGGTQGMNLAPDVYAAIQKSGVPAHMEVDLPDGELTLVTGIYDWESGKAGTLAIPLHVVAPAAIAPAKADGVRN